jgi:LysM repeat protein
MWTTFQELWADVDKSLEAASKYAWETYESLSNAASSRIDKIWKSLSYFATSISNWYNETKKAVVDSVKSAWSEVANLANQAVEWVSSRVDSLQAAISSWYITLKEEWWKMVAYINEWAEKGNKLLLDVKTWYENWLNSLGKSVANWVAWAYNYTVDWISSWANSAANWVSDAYHWSLAYVDGKLQYVADSAHEFWKKADAVLIVAGKVTKPLYDSTIWAAGRWINWMANDLYDSTIWAADRWIQSLADEYNAVRAQQQASTQPTVEPKVDSKVEPTVPPKVEPTVEPKGSSKVEVSSANTKEYTIAPGDNLTKIARKEWVPKWNEQQYITAILEANPWLKPDKLKLNQKIVLPPVTPVTNVASKV